MSYEFYADWWAGSRKVIDSLVQKDEWVLKNTKSVRSRGLANQLVGGLFARYSMAVQDLGQILDQMAHAQKRETVRKIMDAATIRLYELNAELTNIEISEFHYIDGALIELKLVPQNVEILDPIFYFLREHHLEDMWTKIKNGERIYTAPPPPPEPEIIEEPAQAEGENTAPPEEAAPQPTAEETAAAEQAEKKIKRRPKKFEIEVHVLTPEELEEQKRQEALQAIIKLIQTAERGRQGRSYFFEKFQQHKYKLMIRAGVKPQVTEPQKLLDASVPIQRRWRGYANRQLVKRKERERRLLIGMTEPSWKSYAEFEKFEENLQKRRDFRDLRIQEYIDANLKEKDRVYRVIAPGLMEDIGDEIREWFYQWYKQVKNFDKFPPEEKGGTILVVRGETMTPKEWLDDYEKKRREKVKNKGQDKAKAKAEKLKQKKLAQESKKKEKEKIKKELARKRKKKLKPWDFELEFEPNNAKDVYDRAKTEFRKLWDARKDQDTNEERHYFDIIHEEKCYEMQLECRRQVDEMMRLELELLETALAKDRAKQGKKGKKKKKPKKKKKKKGKKGKKDPTASRTTEDLFQELVDNGIIHPYPKASLKDYRGDISYKNWNLRLNEFDPPATLGDVRQVVKLNCILPLSTTSMKKSRSVLLIGPRGCGKHLLANAIFNESQSVLFDLSPVVTAGKYEGKQGMKMLLHLISKMSRLLQPSIIYFDGAEKIFYKKIPPAEKELDPRRLGGKLIKGIVKPIKPEDRVMVLGISGCPWAAKGKIKKAFDKVILLPRTDYGSAYLYWRELLMPYHGVDRDFDVTCLAKLTQSFPLRDIRAAVEQLFTARRIIQLKYNPLKARELYEYFINVEPVSDKEFKKFEKFCKKLPLGKERNRFNKYADKKREQEAKANEKKNQKKK